VVDVCSGCTTELGLFDDAFSQLASRDEGEIDVEWDIVSCQHNSPLYIQNKQEMSRYYFSIQVLNVNWPVLDVNVSADGGNTWQRTVGRDYNFFEHPNGNYGTDVVDIRIACSNKKIIEINNVSMEGGKKHWANSNC
jgi:expansin (peptidoglycan-binding protein)